MNPDQVLPAEPPPPASPGNLPSVLRNTLVAAFGLMAFTTVFTALMAFTHEVTRTRIAAAIEAQQMNLIDEVLPRAQYDNALLQDVVRVEGSAIVGRIWRARRSGEPVSLVFETFASDGYGGRIELIVALGLDGRIGGARVAAHRETPGLGDYIDTAKDRNKQTPWIGQFAGVDASLPAPHWAVKKDGGVFDYHTGATVSARAVTRALGRGAAWINARREAIFAEPSGARLDADGQREQ